MKFLKKVLFVIFLFTIVSLMCVFWATFVEPNLLIVKHVNLHIPNWPKNLDNTKLALVSDLHIGSKAVDLKKIKTITEKINTQTPDIILFLGDFDALLINNSGINPSDIAESFKKLKAPSGVISVLGNHDFSPPDIVKNILIKSNIKILEDESTKITIKGHSVHFVGLKDFWHFQSHANEVISQVKTKGPIIVLAHNPDMFDDIPPNVSLILSGHNHGGEISLPFLGAPFVPSDYGQRFVKGHIAENNKHIYVSSGIGTLSRLRLGNIPEIVILHLYSQENNKNVIQNTSPHKGFGTEFKVICRRTAVSLGLL